MYEYFEYSYQITFFFLLKFSNYLYYYLQKFVTLLVIIWKPMWFLSIILLECSNFMMIPGMLLDLINTTLHLCMLRKAYHPHIRLYIHSTLCFFLVIFCLSTTILTQRCTHFSNQILSLYLIVKHLDSKEL